MSIFKKCKVENCEKKIVTKKYCDKHYRQIKLHGRIFKRTMFDPNEIIDCGDYYEICLYKGRKGEQTEVARAKIDKEDLKKIRGYKWCLDSDGYVHNMKNKKETKLHQLILGKPQMGYNIDHKFGDKLDNRKSELRFSTFQQNSRNRKVKGYSWNKGMKKWEAQICVNYKNIKLGYFIDKQDAIKARKEAELKYFGKFAYKNK